MRTRVVIAGLLTLLITGCGAVQERTIVTTSGDGQTGVVGSMLDAPIVVTVEDADGSPVENYTLDFQVTDGQGALSQASARTDVDGRARTMLTLGPRAGNNTVQVSGDARTAPISITAVGIAGAPVRIVSTSGDGQSGVVGGPLALPLVTTILDAHDNPVAGVTVEYSVTGGGGTVSPTSAATDAMGQAQTSLTLGPTSGANTVRAQAAIATTTFAATGVIGEASEIVIISGNNSSAVAGMALAEPLVIAIRDQLGNGVAGIPVNFAITSGGGTLSTTSATTNAQGQAQTVLTLGSTAGVNTVKAWASVSQPVIFTEAGSSGAATQIQLASTDNPSGTVGTTLPSPLQVKVLDSNSNPVAGAGVTFKITGGNGALSTSTQFTDAQGLAATTLTLGKTAGTNLVEADLASTTASTLFTATGIHGPAYYLSHGGYTMDQYVTYSGIYWAYVYDQYLNPVPGYTVQFFITNGSGSMSSTTATTDATGGGNIYVTYGSTPGTVTLEERAAGLVGSPQTMSTTTYALP